IFLGVLGFAYALGSRRTEAVALLDELSRRGRTEYIDPYSRLEIQMGLGDTQAQCRELQAYIDDGRSGFGITMALFAYDLTSELRFAPLLGRLHVAPRAR